MFLLLLTWCGLVPCLWLTNPLILPWCDLASCLSFTSPGLSSTTGSPTAVEPSSKLLGGDQPSCGQTDTYLWERDEDHHLPGSLLPGSAGHGCRNKAVLKTPTLEPLVDFFDAGTLASPALANGKDGRKYNLCSSLLEAVSQFMEVLHDVVRAGPSRMVGSHLSQITCSLLSGVTCFCTWATRQSSSRLGSELLPSQAISRESKCFPKG